MVDPYQILSKYEGDNWNGLLSELGVSEIFGDLQLLYTNPDSMRKIVRYIVWTYTATSERLVKGHDWESNKRNNFEMSGLPAEMWADVGMLRSDVVLRAIHDWLEFQDRPLFKQIQALRDLKLEMQLSSVGVIVTSSRDNDYDQKFKNARYAIDLGKMIDELESESLHNSPNMQEAVKEVATRKKTMVGPETFSR